MRLLNQSEKGFTLMEVLVALSVLAIALSAIIQSVSTNSSHAGYLREKTMAHWVAMNRIAEIQSMNEYPATGNKRGTEEMAGHEWHWQTTVVDIGTENVRQVQVEVKLNKNDKSNLSSLIALVGKPNK